MNDMKDQSSLSFLSPPSGQELPRFLNVVQKALKIRSDAELAALIGVSPTTVANWKRRKTIPAEHAAWFGPGLIHEIAARWSGQVPTSSTLAVQIVLEVLERTDLNPLGVSEDRSLATAYVFGPLLTLAHLIIGIEGRLGAAPDLGVHTFADRVQATLPHLKAGLHRPYF